MIGNCVKVSIFFRSNIVEIFSLFLNDFSYMKMCPRFHNFLKNLISYNYLVRIFLRIQFHFSSIFQWFLNQKFCPNFLDYCKEFYLNFLDFLVVSIVLFVKKVFQPFSIINIGTSWYRKFRKFLKFVPKFIHLKWIICSNKEEEYTHYSQIPICYFVTNKNHQDGLLIKCLSLIHDVSEFQN